MSVLRGYEDKDGKLHYLIPYLAKWIEDQVTKNIRFYWFWTMVSIWERKTNWKIPLLLRDITGILIDDC